MFRTELKINPSKEKITHQSALLTIGSCFSQVIGDRLQTNKFNVLVNPFGTVFNPVSIVRLLEASLENDLSQINLPVESQHVWFSYHTHSGFYGTTKEQLKIRLEEVVQQAHQQLVEADTLIVTLGTAFVYKLKETNEIVANCHKVPSSNFSKELLSVREITDSLSSIFERIKRARPSLNIILTVSPVRHTKDTIPLNAVSKSALRMACYELSEMFSHVEYFPSFEIMMDDLRDYRFYKEDMIHPTEVAEEYIWNKFSDAYFEEETKKILSDWSSVAKALQHKPFREDSEEYKLFLINLQKRLELLQDKINVRKEMESISLRLKF